MLATPFGNQKSHDTRGSDDIQLIATPLANSKQYKFKKCVTSYLFVVVGRE